MPHLHHRVLLVVVSATLLNLAAGCDSGGTVTPDVVLPPADAPLDALPVFDVRITPDVPPDQPAPDADGGPTPDADAGPGPDTVDGPCVLPESGGWDGCIPTNLSQTGLYTDIAAGTVTAGLREYVPAVPLWSDGADKRRWVLLPEGETIDTSDMDHWQFPVGARFFKEFTRDNVRVETRLVARYGTGRTDFVYAAYQWNEDGTDAVHVPAGVMNASGTDHDIPTQRQCGQCHNVAPQKVLGFSALQLSHDAALVKLGDLIDEGRLSDPPSARTFSFPGDAVTAPALAYLHANCGNCHNGMAVPIGFDLSTSVAATTPEETGPYLTAVDMPTVFFMAEGITQRIVSGDPAQSAVSVRMGTRGGDFMGKPVAMPPIGSELVDAPNVQIVSDWITSLAP